MQHAVSLVVDVHLNPLGDCTNSTGMTVLEPQSDWKGDRGSFRKGLSVTFALFPDIPDWTEWNEGIAERMGGTSYK